MLATPNAVPGALRARVGEYCQLEIKWATSQVGGVTERPLLDLKESSNYKEIKTKGTRQTPSRVIRAADPVGIASADFIQWQYLLSQVDAYSEAIPLALRAAAYLKGASDEAYDITEDDLQAYIAKRQDEADRAKFLFEREDILGRSPRLRLAALLRFSSCLSGPKLEDLVDDVACLKRTWHRGSGEVAPVRVAVQTQLRAALAALPESDLPDPDCPVGARVRVRFDEIDGEDGACWFEGYLVEHRADGKFLCVFEDGYSDWYGLDDEGLIRS
jgi:hypothetical protein